MSNLRYTHGMTVYVVVSPTDAIQVCTVEQKKGESIYLLERPCQPVTTRQVFGSMAEAGEYLKLLGELRTSAIHVQVGNLYRELSAIQANLSRGGKAEL